MLLLVECSAQVGQAWTDVVVRPSIFDATTSEIDGASLDMVVGAGQG